MISLLELGEDVLIDGVFPYLQLKDILNLQMVCRDLYQMIQVPAVWYSLYVRLFKNSPILSFQPANGDISYKNAFKDRWNAKLFTWGDGSNGRLGYLYQEIKAEERAFGNNACGIPKQVTRTSDIHVLSIAGSGYSFILLTTEGHLYGIGDISMYNSGGFTALPLRVLRHNTGETQRMNSHFTVSLAEKVVPKRLRVEDNDEIRFSQVTGGRTRAIGLDESGTQAYIWDSSLIGPGASLDFEFNRHRQRPLRIEKLAGGWNHAAALIEEIGVIVLADDKFLQQKQTETNPVSVEYSVVPHTDTNKVVDIAAGENFVVMCSEKGEVLFVDIDNNRVNEPIVLEAFNGHLDLLTDREIRPKYSRVFANFRHFAAMTDQGDVIFAASDNNNSIIVYPELQENILDLALGDHHFLALTKNGDVLSWGLDIDCHGVFGLGSYNRQNGRLSLANTPSDTVYDGNGRNCRILHPTKVPLNGKALAIGAGGQHSAAIIVNN